MRHRWPLVLAILIYVTLDLSVAEMPGAFVFELGDSVESVQGSRTRADVDVVAAPPAGAVMVGSRPPDDDARRLVLANRVELRWRPVRSRPLLARVDPAPPSEDPH